MLNTYENNAVDDNAPSQAVDGAADKGPIQENVGAADKGSGDNGPGDKGPIEKNVEGSGNVAPQDAEPEREARSFYSSLPIGSATEEVFFLSELMERFPKTLGRLRRLEKEVIDFCFLDDEALDQRADVFIFGMLHKINREEMQCLIPEEYILSNIVEIWSILLNKNQFMLNKEQNNFYFGVEYTVSFYFT
ncbi:uncharacterized protein [Spinacia oleracea]|uniref:Uncharacterized protein n=1 Tax=Spinacia oleracea TaxID=3562 RepID=A0ABM3R7C5_SPIOL|nr:uncharacterized protein LOC130467083 [Spinacia oleracea]